MKQNEQSATGTQHAPRFIQPIKLSTPCPICEGILFLHPGKRLCACEKCWNSFSYPAMKELGILGEVQS